METPQNQEIILELFKQGPDILENAVEGLSGRELDYVPSKGGWSIRQIIHHIVDGDDLWKTGIKIALGGVSAEFTLNWYTARPQSEWAERWGYSKRLTDISLTLFRAIRNHILQLLESSPDAWNMSIQFMNSNGEIEIVPVGIVIKMQSDHVEHHVRRIFEIRNEISGA